MPSCHNITRRVGGTVPKIGPNEREITRLDLLLRRPLPSISLGPLTFTEGDLGNGMLPVIPCSWNECKRRMLGRLKSRCAIKGGLE